MLLFSWVNFRPRQMRAARLPANCWTMTILQPALPNSFGKLFVIIAALARRSILTVRQAPPCQGGCVSSARIAGTIWRGQHSRVGACYGETCMMKPLDHRVGRRGSRSKRYGSFHDQPRTEQRKIESPRVKAPPRG